MRAKRKASEVSQDSNYVSKPATTVESQEDYMISLAINEAEYQIRNHTASSQVITHFLKLGSTKEQQEREKMEEEIKLLKAKTAELEAARERETSYTEVIRALGLYSGKPVDEDDGSEDDYEQY